MPPTPHSPAGAQAPRPARGRAGAAGAKGRRGRKRSGEGRGGRGSSGREAAPAPGCGVGGVRCASGGRAENQPDRAASGAPPPRSPGAAPLPRALPRVPARAAPGPPWGRPSPRRALAAPASASARAQPPAPSRSIYEARAHHVLTSLCPAPAAAAAQTPPRGCAGGTRALRSAARRPRLETLLALGSRRGAAPGPQGRAPRPSSPTSLPRPRPRPPGSPAARTWLSSGTPTRPGRAEEGLVSAPPPTSRPLITRARSAHTARGGHVWGSGLSLQGKGRGGPQAAARPPAADPHYARLL